MRAEPKLQKPRTIDSLRKDGAKYPFCAWPKYDPAKGCPQKILEDFEAIRPELEARAIDITPR